MSARYADFREMCARAGGLSPLAMLWRLLRWKLYRSLSTQPVVRLHGNARMRLQARPQEHGIQAGIFLLREAYEPSVRDAIDRFVAPGARCYDIGANLGLWTLRLAERCGSAGVVYAFEPLPRNARRLEDNARLSGLSNIEILPYALAAAPGEATLFVPDDVGRSALAPETAQDEAVEVKLQRLDDVWESQGRPAVSFVKMDVEGAEPGVLRGGETFFRTVRPVVCCELNPGKLRNMNHGARDILEPFAAWGYSVWHRPDAKVDALAPFDGGVEGETYDLVFLPPKN